MKSRKATNYIQMKVLKKELLLRSAHNQYHINTIKKSIQSLLNQKYSHEFDELVNVIPKLNGFLVHCQQNPEDYTKLTCPKAILEMDVLSDVGVYAGDHPKIDLMSSEDNYRYRNLLGGNKGEPTNSSIFDQLHNMNDLEREALLYRPYHDQTIASE